LVRGEVGAEEALEVRVVPRIATVDEPQRLVLRAVSSSEQGGCRLGDGPVEVDVQLDLRNGRDVALGREVCHSAGLPDRIRRRRKSPMIT